jgi:hypothetical protein
MNPRQRLRKIASSLSAAALLCAATGASAQLAVYKHVYPAGDIVYTDQPQMPPLPEAAPASDAPAAPARFAPPRRYPLVTVSEAQRRLAQAQLKRKQGKAPLAGESVQGPGGATANYYYWRRQEKLRIEVEQAQRRANAVQKSLLARQ